MVNRPLNGLALALWQLRFTATDLVLHNLLWLNPSTSAAAGHARHRPWDDAEPRLSATGRVIRHGQTTTSARADPGGGDR